MNQDPEESFVQFYQEHWSRLVAALSLVLPEGEDPDDLAQETFTRAYEHWSVVQVHPSPAGWLFLTAYRLAAGLRRRIAVRMRVRQEETPSSYKLGDPSGEPLLILTSRQRAAVLLRHHYGLSTRETAEALGCREGTVKSLLARARQTLSETVLEEER